jgi:hypothetical protein
LPSFDLIDVAIEGGLARQLRAWQGEGLSHEVMARRLSEQGFVVSRETVRRWFLRLAEDAEVAS